MSNDSTSAANGEQNKDNQEDTAQASGGRKASQRSSHGPAYYYDRRYAGGPSYYGGPSYGGPSYYGGAYGTTLPYYSSSGNAAAGEDANDGGSVLGPLSISRVLRVIGQKWPTLVVAILLGLGAGFAYYKAAPVSYKATSVIEMSVRSGSYIVRNDIEINDPNTQGAHDEIFNTRLIQLKGRDVVKLVADRVRAEYPSLKTMPDEELWSMLQNSVDFSLQKKSRLVLISVRHAKPDIAKSIANAYAETAHTFSIEQTKESAESAVEWLKEQLEICRLAKERADAEVLKFRVDNQLDLLTSQNESLKLTHNQLATELAQAESIESRASDLLAVLTAIQKDPEKVSSLPENVPRAAEITAAQHAVQEAVTERNALLTRYTDKHPDVEQLNSRIKVLEQQFQESVWRARETAAANLDLLRKQTASLREKEAENVRIRTELGIRISETESKLSQLESARELANQNFEDVSRRMEEVRLRSQDTHATIRVIEEAPLPTRQVSPDPRIAFSAGPVLGLIIGFIFILVLDRVEDKITSSEDIERHMGSKVLALLPHVPRIKRSQLVSLSADKKFSRFAEAFAGLRGLLESPRYTELTKVVLFVSTQPEEGKTITSSNLAVSYGMAGRKTLLVDFDLRRPRIGRMFLGENYAMDEHNSLLDVLAAGDPTKFGDLPIPSGYDNLDIIASKPTGHISPADVLGSQILGKFFEWARKNYERVIIDSAPFGLVSDALALGMLSDSVIIVCRPERSRYGVVRHALRSLSESGSRILGVVVNDVDFGRGGTFSTYDYGSGAYGYSKYGYGGRYGRYGYSSNYYRRNVGSKTGGEQSGEAAPSRHGRSDEPEASSPSPSGAGSILDVDDDE